jgi:outer membrane protein assembly factor BamB
MASPTNLLYVAVGGHIVALVPGTGEELWRTKLQGATSTVVSILAKDGLLFVGASGKAFCLDGLTGTLLWTNELKGLGYGSAFLAAEGLMGDPATAAAAEQARSSD